MGDEQPRLVDTCQDLTDNRNDTDKLADETGGYQIAADIHHTGFAVIFADKGHGYRLPLPGHLRHPHQRPPGFDLRFAPSKECAFTFQQADKAGRAQYGKGADGARRLDHAEIGQADVGVKIAVAVAETRLQHHLARPDRIGDAKTLQRTAPIIRRHGQCGRVVRAVRVTDGCFCPANDTNTFEKVLPFAKLDADLRLGDQRPVLEGQIAGKLRRTAAGAAL